MGFMQALCDLFALSRIHADLIFRNDDYVAGEKAKAIQKLIEGLCKELRNVAVPLVSRHASSRACLPHTYMCHLLYLSSKL